jgi:1-acyl-sn-glycerol-3-phosphate acyltransferase
MLYLRSLAFNAAFYLNLIVQMIFWTPFYFLAPRHLAWFVPKFWSRTEMCFAGSPSSAGTSSRCG